MPIEDITLSEPSRSTGVCTAMLKGVSSVDGMAHALRRIDSRQILPSAELTAAARQAVERWAPLDGHPHIAALRDTFVSADMWDIPAIYFAHDYHAGASTLQALHCENREESIPATESELWSYASQLCCILRAVHNAGLAAGGEITIAPSKVVACISGSIPMERRIRLTAVGVGDVLFPEIVGIAEKHGVALAQQKDFCAAGKLLAVIACGRETIPSVDPIVGACHKCSPPMARLISGLASGSIVDCTTFAQLIAPVMLDSLEAERVATDRLKLEISREFENGRLLRLLIKLAFANERPDGDMDTEWAETGDRYILKLFRDFVFHQHNKAGAPVIDWGHVFESLNKLDVGVPEKIVLLSRDEMSMLVASYADVKRCVNNVYADLVRASKSPGASLEFRNSRSRRQTNAL